MTQDLTLLDYRAEDGWPTTPKHGWTAAGFRAEEVTHTLTARQVGLLVELVEKTKTLGLGVTEITREVFDHPELHDFFASRVRLLKNGQGLVVLDGFPVRELPLDDIWRMYWGIGAHFGVGVSQNVHGHLMGQVMVQPGVVGDRVYGTATMAPLHSDRIDFLSLLCVERAKVGGENTFVSALKIWEMVAVERPDLLPLLLAGYPQTRNGEQGASLVPVTPYRVPVFGEKDRLRSAYFGGNMRLATICKNFPEILGEHDVEALEYLDSVIQRPELVVRQQLEPGQAVFINNMELLHSRTAFEDWDEPGRRRRLLRMWLQGRPRRPYPADMDPMRNLSGNLGIEARVKPAPAAAAV